jgi:Transcriptional regulators
MNPKNKKAMETVTDLQEHGTGVLKELKVNEKKWGKELVAAGWTLLPNVLVTRQKAIGLDPLDINIVLHILSYWWKPGDLPFPSKVTIAEAVGRTPRTVQRRIEAMEKAKFIKRLPRTGNNRGTQTNMYDLSGLIEAAKPYAIEHLQEREKKEKDNAKTVARKGRARVRPTHEDD